MRVIFLGTPEPAVTVLERLFASPHEVAAVVTQPDRPVGRGRRLAPPPVKVAAQAQDVPVHQPEGIRSPEVGELLASYSPDALVVVAYGKILPAALLTLAPLGSVNVHFSLLPSHRGAAPVQRAILAGDLESGVTTMLMDEGLDTGPLLLREPVEIGEGETAPELEVRLAGIGAGLLLASLEGLASGEVIPAPQDDSLATKAPMIKREEGEAPWGETARRLYDRWRGFQPWPGLYSFAGERRLVFSQVRPAEGGDAAGAEDSEPGTILGPEEDAVAVACGGGTRLLIERVRPEGRGEMDGRAAWNGRILAEGLRLGGSG